MKKQILKLAALALTLAACAPFKAAKNGTGGNPMVSQTPVRIEGLVKMEFHSGAGSVAYPTSASLTWTSQNDGTWGYSSEYFVCLNQAKPEPRQHQATRPAPRAAEILLLLDESVVVKKRMPQNAIKQGPIGAGSSTLTLYYNDGSKQSLALSDLSADFAYGDQAMATAETLIKMFREEMEPFNQDRDAAQTRENLNCHAETAE